ncbi:MAG: hypothetical protein H0W83_07710, partial [Planctomycetes bacterium]|nr:hypothetical protein [Planctomycetota bacterium]
CVVVGIALAVALPWLGGRASAAAPPAIAITNTIASVPATTALSDPDPDLDADPAAYLPEDAQAIVRLNDLVRSRERFAHTPYGEFMLTATGTWMRRSMAEKEDASAGSERPAGAAHAPLLNADHVLAQLASTRRVVMGAHLGNGWDRRMSANNQLPQAEQTAGLLKLLKENVVYSLGATSSSVNAELDRQIQDLVHADATVGRAGAWSALTEYGRLTRRGGLLVFSNAPVVDDLPATRGDARQVDAGADLECLSPTGLEVNGQRTPPGWFTSTFDSNGITSRRFSAYGPEDGNAPAWRVRPANLALMRSLPEDTLVAFVRSCSRQQLPLTFTAEVKKAVQVEATANSDDAGTPTDSSQAVAVKTLAKSPDPLSVFLTGLLTRLGAVELPDHLTIDGDCLVYLRAGTPFPSLTLAVACDEADAREVVRAIAAATGTQLDDSGTCRTSISGLVPVQAAYRDGILIATTLSGGIDEHLSRTGGFDGNPEVGAALSQVPASAYAACVMRGGDLLGQVRPFVPMLAHLLPAKDAHALDTLLEDVSSIYQGRYDVFYDTATAEGRSAFASGPLAGPIGMIIDAGMGGLPMARIWN